MKHFIFGIDSKHPAQCARMLRERGIDAVVLGSTSMETAAALAAEGIELYLCFGAYGIAKDTDRLAQDAFFQPRKWFNSGCPNDFENASKHLAAVLEKAAQLPSVRGILVDGARFASFASVEGIESYFTCFCPRCMQALAELGLDGEAIRKAVGRMMQTRRLSPDDHVLIQQWLAFREKTVQRYMDDFAARVHALRSDLIAGAFIFAPSLGAFVGQTANACRSLDVISHMLYRNYHQEFGVACLGHEWAALKEGFSSGAAAFLQTAPSFPRHVEQTPQELLAKGFEPEWIECEVAQGRQSCLTGQQLWPIIQIDDDRVHETAQHAFAGGADAVGLFSYNNGEVPQF